MSEFLEFLEFCWSNKEDNRFSLTKRVKYGFDYYCMTWDLYGKYLTIVIDSKSNIIEFSTGMEKSIIINDPFLYIDLFNRCENEYNNLLDSSINESINEFFDSLENGDKDLSRIWKLNKIKFDFEDDELHDIK